MYCNVISGSGHKGQGLGDDFIGAFHPHQLEGRLEGAGAVDRCHGPGRAGKGGQVLFEEVEVEVEVKVENSQP